MIRIGPFLLAFPALWGAFALWYQVPGGRTLKMLGDAPWILFSTWTIVALWQGRIGIELGVFVIAFLGLLIWWHRLTPTNDRVWADDVGRISTGSVEGNRIILHNVRNFDWRSRTDFTERWETRRYDLDHLRSLDMITSYWTVHAIAHVLMSFGFDSGEHVVFSVEIRRAKDQDFSQIGGFFKEFELSIIAADERDVIRLRTNVRGEDDYLYRIQMPVSLIRELLLAYIDQANGLLHTPRFYNTINVNCTTLVYHMLKRIVGHLPLNHRLLLSGYLPEYVYSLGGLDRRYTLQELRARGCITERAKMADRSETFSADIRRGIPG